MSTRSTDELVNIDLQHVLHPLCPVGQNKGVVFAKGDGVWLEDTEGKRYIDGGSQLANVNLGHGRMDIVDAAMEQARSLQYSSLYYGYSNPPIIECSELLADITPPGLNHFFFGSGGSDANECALRMARFYWQSRGIQKHKIISLYNSYHGSSFGAVSATALSSNFWKGAYPLVPGFIHAPSYYGQSKSNANPADLIAAIIDGEGADSVAAVIAEPVQGAGGIVTPPPEYWPRLREICTKNDVLLIADEVMTGFARTGKMFALEHWKVVPDIMTVAKGITGGYFPFGATILSDKIVKAIEGTQFIHGLTYSGHPICAAAAVKTMQIYKAENILSNVVGVGGHAVDRLKKEFEPLPYVGETGGLGLFLTLEIVADKESGARVAHEVMLGLQKQMLDDGLWIRFSHNRFHICPPLTTTRAEMDQLLDIMKGALSKLAGAGGALRSH